MIKAKVYVMLKPSVLDPQGKTVMHALHSLGYEAVSDVRISKFIEINFDENDKNKVLTALEQICNKVLANPNTEVYSYELIDSHEKLESTNK